MKIFVPSFCLPVLLALVQSVTMAVARADTVAEWKFDSTSDAAGDSVVKLDQSREGASGESRLGTSATVAAVATGISDKWKPFLASGYLEAKAGGGIPSTGLTEINKCGLFTQPNPPGSKNASYAAYFGFSGLGQGTNGDGSVKGGTVYLVLSPMEAFKQGARYGFMGTGHAGDGEVQLGIQKTGDLLLKTGGKAVGAAAAKLTREWQPGTWYFVAASWKANGEPVLYVREMGAAGPEASPEATVGTADGASPDCHQPEADLLAVGAYWFNPGNLRSTVYGAGSRFAYARFDNTYSTKNDIEAVFKSLTAP